VTNLQELRKRLTCLSKLLILISKTINIQVYHLSLFHLIVVVVLLLYLFFYHWKVLQNSAWFRVGDWNTGLINCLNKSVTCTFINTVILPSLRLMSLLWRLPNVVVPVQRDSVEKFPFFKNQYRCCIPIEMKKKCTKLEPNIEIMDVIIFCWLFLPILLILFLCDNFKVFFISIC